MKTILQEQFGFKEIEIKALQGYENLNYRVKTSPELHRDGIFVFKTYPNKPEIFEMIEGENQGLKFLQDPLTDHFPTPVAFKDGSFIKILEIDGEKRICRMLSFLDGSLYGDTESSDILLSSLGSFLAHLDKKLLSFSNPVLKSRVHEWDNQHLGLNKKYLNDIPIARDRNLVRYFFQQFEEKVVPVLPELRKSFIHNDANEWNILTDGKKVSGIFDFGDLSYTLLINELAIALVYACYEKNHPLETCSLLLSAYHKILPLEEIELELLYYLMAARLCISVCHAANARIETPDHDYAFISEEKSWKLLRKWIAINPIEAENSFRIAIGLDPRKNEPIETLIQKREKHISSALSLSYSKPIHFNRSAFQYMYDAKGNTFLDAYNNIPHVGHSHPKVVEAGQRQMAKLNTNTRYVYDLLGQYAEKLLSKFPASLNKVFFVNSGSEASDLAIRIARSHTKRNNLMVVEHGYHGNTQIATDISDYKFSHEKGQGQMPHIIKAALPNSFAGKYQGEGSGKRYALDAIEQIQNAEASIAAFISEPMLGCAGQVPLAKGYLERLYPAIRKQGGLCISDEVQTGFGRLGDFFWGYEMQAVIPDIVVLGKPMGNGHPIGAVITSDELAESFGKGPEFFSSFGGNPVSCAIGLAVLEVLEEEELQDNAKTVGAYYRSLLEELQKEFPSIGDVRGSGLFLGIEMVKAGTKDPDKELAQHIKNELRNRHILIGTDGPNGNVLKTKPPLCFSKENAGEVCEKIAGVLKKPM